MDEIGGTREDFRRRVLLVWRKNREIFREKLAEFEKRGLEGKGALLEEGTFCLLTPQSKAERAWKAVEMLRESGLLFSGNEEEIAGVLRGYVRFHNQKAKRVVEFREKHWLWLFNLLVRGVDDPTLREELVGNVKGYGYKEATHLLRNLGRAKKMAILDRHILRILKEGELLNERVLPLTPRRYLEIEGVVKEFSEEVGIPMVELDLVFWTMSRGSIFK